MVVTVKALQEKRADIIRKAQQLNTDKADKETGLLAAEDVEIFDRMLNEADDVGEQVNRLQKLQRAQNRLEDIVDPRQSGEDSGLLDDPENTGRPNDKREGKGRRYKVRENYNYQEVDPRVRGTYDYEDWFGKFLRDGTPGLTPDQKNALQSDDDQGGGYLRGSEQFVAEMLKELDDEVFVRRHARVHTQVKAASLGRRKRSARLSTFTWGTELQAPTADTSLKYGKRVLSPHYLTGSVRASRDLLRSSVIGVEAELKGELARDAGEVQEDAFLLGNGSGRPLGVFIPSSDGISTARDISDGNSTTAVAYDGLLNAKYSLKSGYRRASGSRSGCRWLFNRTVIRDIVKLKDGNGYPIFVPARTEHEMDMLLGYPVDESERTPNTMTTGQYVGLLANWFWYEIAEGLDHDFQRLEELYAESNEIGYIDRMKVDGMPTLEEAYARVTLS